VNKNYLEIAIKEDINDFRSKRELRSKITEMRINRVLVNLFKNAEFIDYLKTRISV
jgi:hypothetical protein